MSQMITERVVFSGRVQGVGFRYMVRSIANQKSVRGYVKNLSDGTVELVMQGTTVAMNDLLAQIGDRFRGSITHCERCAIEANEHFHHFDIRF